MKYLRIPNSNYAKKQYCPNLQKAHVLRVYELLLRKIFTKL